MAQQLRLIDRSTDRFRLDERTKATGRRGIEKARAALAASAERTTFVDPAVAGLGERSARPAPRRPATDDSADAA
jgi:hypothetical protein